MSSESSLATTAASDTSSSADSRYYSGGARRRPTHLEATSIPQLLQVWYTPTVQPSPAAVVAAAAAHFPRRRTAMNGLKARGAVIAKPGSGNQKVLCACKSCKGQRMVSKSTCYRHLRVEKEIEEDDAKWEYARWANAHKSLTPSSHQRDHLPSIPVRFHPSQLVQ